MTTVGHNKIHTIKCTPDDYMYTYNLSPSDHLVQEYLLHLWTFKTPIL